MKEQQFFYGLRYLALGKCILNGVSNLFFSVTADSSGIKTANGTSSLFCAAVIPPAVSNRHHAESEAHFGLMTIGIDRFIPPAKKAEVVKTITSDYAMTPDDVFINADSASNPIMILLAPAIENQGLKVWIKKKAIQNYVVLLPDGSDMIEGSPILTLRNAGDCVMLISDGANWNIA